MNQLKLAALAVVSSLAMANSPASAETVAVKYVGPVNLQSMSCANTSSSLVHRICYRESGGGIAIVLLRDTYYAYCGVPAAVMTGWLNSSSLGRYFNQNIKGVYDCRGG